MFRVYRSISARFALALAVCLAACAVSASALANAGPPPKQLVFFGDSLTDSGNNYLFTGQVTQQPFTIAPPDRAYAIGGHHFTNGQTWAEQLSESMGLPLSGHPSLRQPGLFTNYAVGDARARANSAGFPYYDLSTQVNQYLYDFGGHASPDTLYVIWMGANDLDDALQAIAANPQDGEAYFIVQDAITAIAANIRTLYGAGARQFLIVSVPDLGKTPYARYLGATVSPAVPFTAHALTYSFDSELRTVTLGLAASLPGIRYFQFLDINTLFDAVYASPESYGFTDVTDRCTAPNTIAHSICEDPQAYLFWDATHPTKAAHGVIAADVLGLLPH